MATISGTVKNVAGNFAQRIVRAYRRSDGAFASQAVSDATTGAFSCAALDTSAHYALTLDGEVAEYDPYWNSVVLAMHMDDAGLSDLKGHAVTLSGNAARSSAQSKFGGYSAAFEGSGGLVAIASSSDFAFNTGDFTIEFWYWQSVAGTAHLVDCRPTESNNGAYVCLYVSSSAKISLWVNSADRITGGAVTTGTWNHVALCRSGGSTRLFVNGAQAGSTYADTTSYISSPVNIGASGNFATVLKGYIDDLRITKGVARYTANFTPPSSAFPGGPVPGAPTANALILDNITPV